MHDVAHEMNGIRWNSKKCPILLKVFVYKRLITGCIANVLNGFHRPEIDVFVWISVNSLPRFEFGSFLAY